MKSRFPKGMVVGMMISLAFTSVGNARLDLPLGSFSGRRTSII